METIIKLWSQYHSVFLEGLSGTLWLAAITVFFGTIVGVIVAMMRMSKVKILNFIVVAYTNILRGTPVLLQLYFFWLLLPKVVPIELSDTVCIIIALIVNSSSYISEIIRAGIEAVDRGQWEAGRSLGLSEKNLFMKVVFPQCIKNILPALVNQFIMMVKETSLASIFFVGELMTSYKTVQSTTFLSIQPLIIAGFIYYIVTTVLTFVVNIIEKRMKKSD